MKIKNKDKRFTKTRVVAEVHKAYDFLEVVSLMAAEKALKDEFGFGETRLARFRDAYLMNFGEAAAMKVEEMRKDINFKGRNI